MHRLIEMILTIVIFQHLLLLSISTVISVSDTEWQTYKKTYNKKYNASLEDWIRRELYSDNLIEIDEFNAKQALVSGYRLSPNQFSDMTKSELTRLSTATKMQRDYNISNNAKAEQYLNDLIHSNKYLVALHKDWRSAIGRVSRVKDQSNCRSSWPFVVTGLVEGQNGKTNEDLSEQNLIDCVPGYSGCITGLIEPSLVYIQSHGLQSESKYPWSGGDQKDCKADDSGKQLAQTHKRVLNYAILPRGDEKALEKVVALYGPVGVVLRISTELFYYKSGIYHERNITSSCRNKIERKKGGHGMLIVGYGTDPIHGQYWILKNSWGPSWGEQGFMRLSRNRYNQAGVACNALIVLT